jgi:hypothetical protein
MMETDITHQIPDPASGKSHSESSCSALSRTNAIYNIGRIESTATLRTPPSVTRPPPG